MASGLTVLACQYPPGSSNATTLQELAAALACVAVAPTQPASGSVSDSAAAAAAGVEWLAAAAKHADIVGDRAVASTLLQAYLDTIITSDSAFSGALQEALQQV